MSRIEIPQSFNLAQYVLTHANVTPDKTALKVVGGPALTFSELSDAVLRTAQSLREQIGYKSGRVLLRLGNTSTFPIVYLAAIAVDLVPVVTSSKLSQREVDEIAKETQPDLVVCDTDLSVPIDNHHIIESSALNSTQRASFKTGNPNRPAYIIYTSGTSGKPRAVEHAHRAVLARQSMHNGWYGITANDRVMHAGAFNWTYTLGTGLIDPWSVGATAVIPEEGTDPASLPKLLADEEITIFAAAPGIYRRMNRATFPKLPKLRHGLSAGEKLPPTTRENWFVNTGRRIHEAFGLSECSTFISGSPSKPAPSETLGFPQPKRKIALIDNGKLSMHGVIAIHKSDPGLMRGYLNQPDETQLKYDGDWFLTGDIGSQNPDGSITYQGRADDMMNAGGTRVSPLEVEAILNTCSEIDEAACAEVALNPEVSLIAAFYTAQKMIDEADVKAMLHAQLADYKVPRIFVRVASLPRGNNNKLLRQKLRQDWEATNGQT